MILPLISVILPALIQSAETIFVGEKKGPEKKAFVMAAINLLMDQVPLPKYIEKKMLVDIIAVLIDHYVPNLLK